MILCGIRARLRGEESGFVMITAVVLLGVMGTLMALVMSVGTHTNFATARGRSWTQVLHVAEAGVHQAISYLDSTDSGYSGTFTGSTDEGTFTVTVTPQPRKRIRIDATGVVPGSAGLGATRKLRVTMAPPASFLYAMLSNTSIVTKGNDVIDGDVWSNQNVLLEQNNIVHGSVTAATGWIATKNGVTIDEDAWSGGYDPNNLDRAIHLEAGGVIGGNAKASVTAPPSGSCGGEPQTKYKIRLEAGATIVGNATTWGPIIGSGTVQGTSTWNVCTTAPPTRPLPTFTYSSDNYDAATLHEYGTPDTSSATAVTEFQTYVAANAANLQGTFYINQIGPVNQNTRIDLTGVTITGDTTIIANVPIFTNSITDNTSDAIFTVVSTYQPPTGSICDVNQDASECTIHLKNNFDASGNTAVVVYAPFGPVAIKNNQAQFGTIYADAIEVKNNQTLNYDSRVERMVGFGPVTYEVETWLELQP